jgi:predicted dehydrogenase
MASAHARSSLRIGLVGAGRVMRRRHIPGLQAIPGVTLAGVCNRRRETASRVAREFGVPRTFSSWEDLVDDDAIDAVVIATWPDLHAPVTLAALDAGKHVLTQAPMAMNAREAQRMLEKLREHPTLTTMVAPSPYGLVGDRAVRALIDDGFLGTLREVHVTGFGAELADPETRLSWRQITRYSGFNALDLGFLHEAAMRWTPPVTRVFAYASKQVGTRRVSESRKRARVGTPDSVQVLTSYEGHVVGTYRVSGVARHVEERSVVLVGSAGTIRYDLARDSLFAARADEAELTERPIPDELRGAWRAEADFVAAIRGERPVERNDFETGARVMHFTEAVARSSRHQEPVWLPLREFSNPSL